MLIGIDASSSKRLEKLAKEDLHFQESLIYPADSSSLEALHLSNFSIMEALFKALNCPTLFPRSEIRISREDNGKPKISFTGRMQESWKNYSFAVSVTHLEDLIIAVVVADSNKREQI